MLYLVYVLTFLAGILFYAFSPRDDQVNLDVYRAEGFIASFVAQHQAAKDYMTQWLGVQNPHSSSFNLTRKQLPADPNYEFEKFFPRAVLSDVSPDQTAGGTFQNIASNDDWHYQTSVFCFTDGPPPSLVNCDSPFVKGRYLVTYSGLGRPDWWPKVGSNRQRRYETWRNALVRRTNGSYNCGVLVCGQYWNSATCKENAGAASGAGFWCVDNGQTIKLPTGECAQKVPIAITNALGCENANCSDTFFCISRVKQGPKKYYVSDGLTAFYDGINNQNTGAEGDRGSNVWYDMIRTTGGGFPATGVSMDGALLASGNGVSFPDLNIVNDVGLYRPFTLTLLIKGSTEPDNDISIDLDTLGYFQIKLTQMGGAETATLNFIYNNGGTSDIWLSGADTEVDIRGSILSLTLIGYSDKVEVYANKTLIGTIESSMHQLTAVQIAHIKVNGGDITVNSLSSGVPAYIYGVRYYSDKSLTTTETMKNGKRVPSELEQNLKMDSKRYSFGY